MCAVHGGACQTSDARAIATAVDAATDSDELRAELVVAAWEESGFRLHPRPQSWDAHAGIARGPWQLWRGGDGPLATQARAWLWLAQRGGLAGMCGYGPAAARIAFARAREAERLLALVR